MRDATDITIVLDASGSMGPLATEVVTGFNKFLAEQKEDPSPCTVTVYMFADSVQHGDPRPLVDYPMMQADRYQPGGMTALNDAIGTAIVETGKRLAAMDEADRPDKVVVLVMTDGHENCSQEFNNNDVRDMVDRQTNEFNWTFVYLGANVDAFDEGHKRGFARQNVSQYSADSKGVGAVYAVASSALRSARSSGPGPIADAFFDAKDRAKLDPNAKP